MHDSRLSLYIYSFRLLLGEWYDVRYWVGKVSGRVGVFEENTFGIDSWWDIWEGRRDINFNGVVVNGGIEEARQKGLKERDCLW